MNDFIELDIQLKADNSSGIQTLYCYRQDGEYGFTLTGDYEGKEIQIDFDGSTKNELVELRDMIDIMLET